jgi:hypothetical protein
MGGSILRTRVFYTKIRTRITCSGAVTFMCFACVQNRTPLLRVYRHDNVIFFLATAQFATLGTIRQFIFINGVIVNRTVAVGQNL